MTATQLKGNEMNDIEEAFGFIDDQPEVVETSTREQGLTELHQTKADALATVRPLRELTVEKHGIKKVIEGRKAVVKLRTSVDKRRKSLNEEAKKWIDTVNGTAKEILSIIEPVELHLKGQEALHEERQRQAEEAERLERVAVRRAAWPADAGTFPESEAATRSAVDWQVLTQDRQKAEAERREEAARREAERLELEKLRREKAEAEQRFAEQLRREREAKLAAEREAERLRHEQAEAERQARQAAERERLAIQHTEEQAAFEAAEAERLKIAAALAERLEAEREASLKAALDKRAKLWDEHESESIRAFAEPPSDPVVLPISEGVGRMADDLRQGWSVEPPVKPSRNIANRLWDLVAAVKEIVAMDGEPDWRGLLTEALEDATE